MNLANVVLLILAALMASGTNAIANGASLGNLSTPAQSTNGSGSTQSYTDMTMNVPLLVNVDATGQVRSIQHSQRLPTEVNDLLWKSVKSWTKTSAVIDGKHAGAQLLMNVTLHAEPQSGGKTNVYFTLASEGTVLHGYWRMQGNHLYGHCPLSNDASGGFAWKGFGCTAELVPASTPSAPRSAVK